MEMLIVVAIMAVLIAVSIPIATKQLNEANAITDEANLRAAKSVANVQYMMQARTFSSPMYYDINIDDYVEEKPSLAYGKATEHIGMVISAVWDDSKKTMVLTWE